MSGGQWKYGANCPKISVDFIDIIHRNKKYDVDKTIDFNCVIPRKIVCFTNIDWTPNEKIFVFRKLSVVILFEYKSIKETSNCIKPVKSIVVS